MDELRVGVAGVGHMGSYHVVALGELVEANLAAIADQDRARARELAGKYEAESFSRPEDLVGKVDAVIVAVPTAIHYGVSRMFLENGIHVLVEKPICTDIVYARNLFRIATENNLVLHIGHVERFNGAVQELSRIVRDPTLIECRRLGPFVARAMNDGVVLDLMIHDLDIILRLVEEEVTSLSATGAIIVSERDDVANAQIQFSGGCIASLTASRVTENKIRTLGISQPGAFISLDYADQELRIHRQSSSEHSLSRDELKYSEQIQVERVFVHKDNPLKLELRHFLASAQAGNVVENTERELRSLDVALRVLQMLNVPIPASI
ncbi:MAG: Gfo/Idh/MocA family oxidoreductase [Nitrospinota bacterium]